MSDAEEIEFACEESPSRVSGVLLRARARQIELPLDAAVYCAVPRDELDWFALSPESTALVEAIDGRSTLKAAFDRAGISVADGLPHASILFEMGIVAFK